MKYYNGKDHQITVCVSDKTGIAVGIIGQVGHLLEQEIILTDVDEKSVNRAAWIFVDRASGYTSPELSTKEAAKEYAERIYK